MACGPFPADLRTAKEVQTVEVYRHEVRALAHPFPLPYSPHPRTHCRQSLVPPSLAGVCEAP